MHGWKKFQAAKLPEVRYIGIHPLGSAMSAAFIENLFPGVLGAATHEEELHLRCSYETAWGYNGRNDSWENSRKATLDYKITPGVSEGAIYLRSCLSSPLLQSHVYCWKLALEKLSTLLKPGAVETEMVAASWLENHSRTRKRIPFLLQCLSRTLY